LCEPHTAAEASVASETSLEDQDRSTFAAAIGSNAD
jgi:hypothetical protein